MSERKTLIAIVDDEEDLCFLLSRLLALHGFEVKSYYTLTEGLHGIEKDRPDWIILDNNLPDGLGWNESEHILNIAPASRLINISANPDSPRDFRNPRVHYLIKPIDASMIVNIIRQAIN
jgi:DNA-binding NtrC family response regulator